MDILEIIEKKNQEEEINASEFELVFSSFENGELPEIEFINFLKLINDSKLSDKEIVALTNALVANSHHESYLNCNVDEIIIDALDTKISIILDFLVASMGVSIFKEDVGIVNKLQKTLDINLNLSKKDVLKQLDKINVVFVNPSVSSNKLSVKIKKLLHDNNIKISVPIAAALTMSNKLLYSSSKIMMEVKFGKYEYLKTIDDAKEYIRLTMKIGHLNAKDIICVLTEASEPVGFAIGDSLEMVECINTLKGEGPKDLNELIIHMASIILSLEKGIPVEESIEYAEEALRNKFGYEKFMEFVKTQKGNVINIKLGTKVKTIKAKQQGYIESINTLRLKKMIENADNCGVLLNAKVGDLVMKNDDLLSIYFDNEKINEDEFLKCFELSEKEIIKPRLIKEIIK